MSTNHHHLCCHLLCTTLSTSLTSLASYRFISVSFNFSSFVTILCFFQLQKQSEMGINSNRLDLELQKYEKVKLFINQISSALGSVN